MPTRSWQEASFACFVLILHRTFYLFPEVDDFENSSDCYLYPKLVSNFETGPQLSVPLIGFMFLKSAQAG